MAIKLLTLGLPFMLWDAGAIRQQKRAQEADFLRSRLPDCKTFCSQSFEADKRNNALPQTMTLDMYVPACTKQQSRKGTCVDSPSWDPSRGVYYAKPFALPQGQTCNSVCEQKAQDKLSNPYAPLYATEYISACLPKCQQYAQTWDANRGVYNDKPFALPQGQTCKSVCEQKAQDKLSNPYAPLFATEYVTACLPKCQQYALPDCWTFCIQSYENDKRNNAIPPTMTLEMYVPVCTKQQSQKGTCAA